jgi:hypothetical protein
MGFPEPMPLDDGDVCALHTAASSDLSLRVVKQQSDYGRRVRVLGGRRGGIKGYLFEKEGRILFGINLKLIGQTWEFDAGQLPLRPYAAVPGRARGSAGVHTHRLKARS